MCLAKLKLKLRWCANRDSHNEASGKQTDPATMLFGWDAVPATSPTQLKWQLGAAPVLARKLVIACYHSAVQLTMKIGTCACTTFSDKVN